MTEVNVATLKEKLSYYLGLVKKGQEIVDSTIAKEAEVLTIVTSKIKPD